MPSENAETAHEGLTRRPSCTEMPFKGAEKTSEALRIRPEGLIFRPSNTKIPFEGLKIRA
jgi:hypothetical protein